MNKPIGNFLIAAAAAFILPHTVYSEQSSLTPSPDQNTDVTQSSDVTNDGAPERLGAPKENESNLGGVLVHDGKAYIVSRLQNEMSLPDGRKIEPDGTVYES